jgi:tape measure domain-containing protein
MANDANLRIGADTRQATAAINKLNRDLAAVKLDSLINLGARAKDAAGSMTGLIGRFQETKVVLNKMTSGQGMAKFEQISDIAKTTQFDVNALTDAFVKMQGAGVDGATEKLSTFADIAGGTSDQMGTLSAMSDLFARTVSGGLNLENLNRLMDRGIPVFKVLQDEMGLTKDEITKYGKSAQGAKEITDTLLKALGVKYADLSSEQANTVAKAWDNAGMSGDELAVTIYEKMGVGDGLLWLAKVFDGATISVNDFLKSTDDLTTRMGRLSTPQQLANLPAEIIALEQQIGALYRKREKITGRGGFGLQQRIDALTKELATAKGLHKKAFAEHQVQIDKDIGYEKTKRKQALDSAIISGLGGFESPKLAIQKAKEDRERLGAAELVVTEKTEAQKMKITEAYRQIDLREAKAHADLKLENEKKILKHEHDALLKRKGYAVTLELEIYEFSQKLNEQKNEVLDRLDEARLANKVGYLNEETQALLRHYDFEVRLAQRTEERKTKIVQAEQYKRIRKEGFNHNESKQMAETYAEFDKKTQTEKTEWAISQGAEALTALGQHSKAAFKAAKAFNIAQAVMNTYTGATKALASYPPPYNFIAAAAVIGMGMANVATIRNQQYQGRQFGGTVTGNKPYMVGEKGPELMIPGRTGTVVNNGQLQGGGTTNITFEITATDANSVDELITERKEMIVNMVRSAHEDAGFQANL